MGNLGSGELLVIFFVALLVLGPNKLPDAARQVGRAVNEIRRVSGGFQREMREAMREPMRAAEQAKADMLDPFNQAASAAAAQRVAETIAMSNEKVMRLQAAMLELQVTSLLHVQTALPVKQRVLETATRPFPLVSLGLDVL